VPARLRSLIGTLLLIALVAVYALVASAVAVTQLAESSAWVHLAFFAASGLVWVLPAMLIIWWMARPGKPKPEA
jgi:glucan phosphoethanolaminetransferase (alkaline phosphatase superfamily)